MVFPGKNRKSKNFLIYFDGFCDARSHSYKGHDDNDYTYNVSYIKDSLLVDLALAPDWQVAFLKRGPAPEVKSSFRKTAEGMIYELAFPAKYVYPISLENSSSFGFALLINENDNDYRKRGLTLTPEGTEPWRTPHLWPVMILEE